jgi:hypothetical protein
LLRWKRINRIYGFSRTGGQPTILRKQQLSCGTSSVITMDFGHLDHQTSCHLASFCGDFLKKESKAITQEVWMTLDITMNRLLPALANMLFENLPKKKKHCEKGGCLSLKGWGTFSTSAVITRFFITYFLPLKKLR